MPSWPRPRRNLAVAGIALMAAGLTLGGAASSALGVVGLGQVGFGQAEQGPGAGPGWGEERSDAWREPGAGRGHLRPGFPGEPGGPRRWVPGGW